ncbi:hypothetical protein [Blautia obeum]|uniref:hypothetical protein n=1 Tax=Blautia obeum TaxID=40520 RepID=UPI003CFDF468
MNQKKEGIICLVFQLIKDSIKMLFIGLLIGFINTIVLFLCGYLFSGISINGLEIAKDGLFLITSILLFLIAGMLIIKGKKQEKGIDQMGWKKHFHVIGLKTAITILCVAFLSWASLIDYLMLQMK